jgi:predicted hydrocarbon binding protein
VKHDPARGEFVEGDARYLLIRNDSLMGLFSRLPEPARAQALSAFADSLAEYGGRSAARYAAQDRGRLLAAVQAKAIELGWGVWRFEHGSGALALAVENSPFAAGCGESREPVCAPIAGMLRAMASLVLGAPAAAREMRCAAQGAARCEFVATAQ